MVLTISDFTKLTLRSNPLLKSPRITAHLEMSQIFVGGPLTPVISRMHPPCDAACGWQFGLLHFGFRSDSGGGGSLKQRQMKEEEKQLESVYGTHGALINPNMPGWPQCTFPCHFLWTLLPSDDRVWVCMQLITFGGRTNNGHTRCYCANHSDRGY